MSRRKFTSKFKAKVVLESLKETHTMAELAQKYQLHPQQISNWKREFLDNAEKVFTGDKANKKTEAERKEETLLKVIGQQKIEIDFLKDALR
jgi:transposase